METPTSKSRSSKPLGVACIGLGRLGLLHAQHLHDLTPGARLNALVDSDPRRLSAAANLFPDAAACTDVSQVLDDPNIEAVVLATNTDSHASLVRDAAAAGKHIFCEKPLALNLADATSAQDAARRAGVVLRLGFMRRFDPALGRAKELIAAGDIGRPLFFRASSCDGQISESNDFLASCGGLLLDVALHDFDLAEWLMDRPIQSLSCVGEVAVHERLRAYDDVDTALVTLEFQGGGLGSIYVSHTASYGYDIATEVVGSEQTVRTGTVLRDHLTLLSSDGRQHRDTFRDFLDRYADAYRLELADFVRLLTGLSHRPDAADGAVGVRTLQLALAARQALHQHSTVEVAPTLAPPPAERGTGR